MIGNKCSSVWASFCAAVLLTACGHVALADGVIVNLGTISPDTDSKAYDINESGVVVGASGTQAFRYVPGMGMEGLGILPGGTRSYAYAINEAGTIVGGSTVDGSTTHHPFRWKAGVGMQDLGSLGGPQAYAWSINDSGTTVGYAERLTPSINWTAFSCSDTGSSIASISMLPNATGSGTRDINTAGVIVGYSNSPSISTYHAVRRTSNGTVTDLGTMGYNYSIAWAINDAGTIVGDVGANVSGDLHAFRYTSATGIQPLESTTKHVYTCARDINEADVVVGYSYIAYDNPAGRSALLWTADNSLIDLNQWLDAVDPVQGGYWMLRDAQAINNAGMVVGFGVYNDGEGGLSDGTRAFILDASSLVPEPGSAMIVALAMGIMVLRRSK